MRLLLLISGLWLGLCAAAQDGYLPMLQYDRTWCGVEGGWVPTPVTYWVESDTTIADGTLWHKVAIQYEGSENAGFAGWLHEDAENEQVWMRWDLDLDPGTLWFDFGMEPGDVMVAPNCDWADITCLAVDSFTWTDGTVSRRLKMQLLPDNPEFVEFWIEGIGSENGPMGPAAYLCIADWDPHAACVVDGGQVRHDFAMDTTWLPAHSGCAGGETTGIPETQASDAALVLQNGKAHWSGVPGEIGLYDLMGRHVATFMGEGPWLVPSVGMLIAILPNGRKQKIRID